MNVKKLLAILLCVATVMCAFVGCSAKDKGDETTLNPNEITTDDAVIVDKDAIDLIKSYSPKELGISEDDYKNCSFMIAESGSQIDGKFYVKVIVAKKIENEPNDKGEVTYSFDTKGEYYISYDGKSILKKDMKSDKDKYSKMKVKEAPTSEKAEEETTKK